MGLKIENNSLKAEYTKIKTRISQIEKDNARKNELIKELSNKEKSPTHINIRLVGSLKQTIKELKSEIKNKDEELQKLRKNIKITKINELEVEIKTFTDECIRLRQGMEDLIRKKAQEFSVFSSPEEFKLKDSIIIGLRKEKNDLSSAITSLQEENLKYKERLLDFERTRKRPGKKEPKTGLKTEIQRLKAKMDESTKDYKDKEIWYMNEIAQNKKNYDEMKAKFLTEEKKNKELNQNMEKLKDDIQKIKTPILKTPIIPNTPEKNIKTLVSSDLYSKINKILIMKKIRLLDFIGLIDKSRSGYCEVEDFIKVFKEYGQEISKNDIEGGCCLQNGKKVVLLKIVEEGYENMKFIEEDNYDDEGFEDEKGQEKLLFVQKIESIPSFSIENTLGGKMVKLVSFDEVEVFFKHVAFSMQLNRLPKTELCKWLFDMNLPNYKELTKEELVRCFKDPPFVFTNKHNIDRFCLFLIQPDEEHIEENKLPQLSATLSCILKKLTDNLPDWNVFTPEEENQFDELLYQLIQEHKNTLKSNCKVFDKEKKRIIPLKNFMTALKNTGISLEKRPLDYILLLFYSHENEIDSVPYKNFIQAYCEPNSAQVQAEADIEKLEAIKQGLFLIAQAMIKSKITVKEVFQNDHGIIYPEGFISGLEYLGLKHIENEIVLLILEELQYEKESENCILLEEFEKIMESLGVSYKKPKRSVRSFSSKGSSASMKKKTTELENYDYSEDLPEKYGISEISPFESGSNIDPQKSFTKLELERVNDKSSSVCSESVEKLGFYEKSVRSKEKEIRISDLNKDITSSKNEILDEGVNEEEKIRDTEEGDMIFKEGVEDIENFDYSNDFEEKSGRRIEKARESSELLIIARKSEDKYEFRTGLNEDKEKSLKLEKVGFSGESAESIKKQSRNSSDNENLEEVLNQKLIKIDDFVDENEKKLLSEKGSEKMISSFRENDSKSSRRPSSEKKTPDKESQNYSEDSDSSSKSKNKSSHKSSISIKSLSEKGDKKSLKSNRSSKLSEKSSEKNISYRGPPQIENLNSSLNSSQKEFKQSEEFKCKDFASYSQKSEKDIKLSEMPSEKNLQFSSKPSEKSLKLSENPSEMSLISSKKNSEKTINLTGNLSDKSLKLIENSSNKSIKLSEKSMKVSEKSSQKSLKISNQYSEEFLNQSKNSNEKILILSESSSEQSSKSIVIFNDNRIVILSKSSEKRPESSRKSSKKSKSDSDSDSSKSEKNVKSSSSSSKKSSKKISIKSSRKNSFESGSENIVEEKNMVEGLIKDKENKVFVQNFEFSEESHEEKYEVDYEDDNFDDSVRESIERKEKTIEYEEGKEKDCKNQNNSFNNMDFEVVQPEKPLSLEVGKLSEHQGVKESYLKEDYYDNSGINVENDDKLSDKSENPKHHENFDKPFEISNNDSGKPSMGSKKYSENFINYNEITEKKEEDLEKGSNVSEKLSKHSDVNSKHHEKNTEKSDKNLEKSCEYSEASFENPENFSKSPQKSFDSSNKHEEIIENKKESIHEDSNDYIEEFKEKSDDAMHAIFEQEKNYDKYSSSSEKHSLDEEKPNAHTIKNEENKDKNFKGSENHSEFYHEEVDKKIDDFRLSNADDNYESSDNQSIKKSEMKYGPNHNSESDSEDSDKQANQNTKDLENIEKVNESTDKISIHSDRQSRSSEIQNEGLEKFSKGIEKYEENNESKSERSEKHLTFSEKPERNIEENKNFQDNLDKESDKLEESIDHSSSYRKKSSKSSLKHEDSSSEKEKANKFYEESDNFKPLEINENHPRLSNNFECSSDENSHKNNAEIKQEIDEDKYSDFEEKPSVFEGIEDSMAEKHSDYEDKYIAIPEQTYEESYNLSSEKPAQIYQQSNNSVSISNDNEIKIENSPRNQNINQGLIENPLIAEEEKVNNPEEIRETYEEPENVSSREEIMTISSSENPIEVSDTRELSEQIFSLSSMPKLVLEGKYSKFSDFEENFIEEEKDTLNIKEKNDIKNSKPSAEGKEFGEKIEDSDYYDEKFESGSEKSPKSSRLIEKFQRCPSEEAPEHDNKIEQSSESNEDKEYINQ